METCKLKLFTENDKSKMKYNEHFVCNFFGLLNLQPRTISTCVLLDHSVIIQTCVTLLCSMLHSVAAKLAPLTLLCGLIILYICNFPATNVYLNRNFYLGEVNKIK